MPRGGELICRTGSAKIRTLRSQNKDLRAAEPRIRKTADYSRARNRGEKFLAKRPLHPLYVARNEASDAWGWRPKKARTTA
jgi:hypothetical protein